MHKRLRLKRRFPVAMTEDGYRRLKKFAQDSHLEEGEALSFLFKNFDSVINKDTFGHCLKIFHTGLPGQNQ